jgi:GNAT superfamily N-acetyltransferase
MIVVDSQSRRLTDDHDHELPGGRPHVSESLAGVLADAASGRFPPADGGVTIMPQPSPRDAGVIGFTAHAVIFVDADPAWVASQLPAGDLSGPLSPPFLHALSQATSRPAGSIDMLCAAEPLTGPAPVDLSRERDPAHPRIARALRYRDDVRAWRTRGGVVLLGRGVAGRWETAIEVDQDQRGRGLGRQLATAARHLVPAGEPLWAQGPPATLPASGLASQPASRPSAPRSCSPPNQVR